VQSDPKLIEINVLADMVKLEIMGAILVLYLFDPKLITNLRHGFTGFGSRGSN